MYNFVKKEDVVDGNEYYFLGKAHYLEGTAEETTMPNEKKITS